MVEYTDLHDLDRETFLCKALWTHAWSKNPSPKNIDGEIARMSTAMLCLVCDRCGRERYDYIDSQGRLLGRYYKNPTGYPRTHKFTGDELRAEMLSRSVLVRKFRHNGKR